MHGDMWLIVALTLNVSQNEKRGLIVFFFFALDVLCVAFLLKTRWGNCSPSTEKEQDSDVDEDNCTGKVFVRSTLLLNWWHNVLMLAALCLVIQGSNVAQNDYFKILHFKCMIFFTVFNIFSGIRTCCYPFVVAFDCSIFQI